MELHAKKEEAPQPELPPKFTEVAVLTDREGLVAPITVREVDGNVRFSFAIMREFDRNGRTERTAYLHRRHVEAARRLLDQVEEHLDKQEDQLRAELRNKRGRK